MTIGKAFELAFDLHWHQKDKAGDPYIAHVVRVAAAMDPLDQIAVVTALLHDVVEDTECTLHEIRRDFGHEIADAVDAMTKRAGEDYHEYLSRVKGNTVARKVKLADIADNSNPARIARLPPGDQDRLHQKYQTALDALQV